MTNTNTEIISVISNHVRVCGGQNHEWYVGVASDAKSRLFNDHNVSESNGAWIYRAAFSSADAREVEDYFIRQGMDGGPGGGDDTTDKVYAYKKTSYTRE